MLVFDLDGTVVNSYHRTQYLANGDIDIKHWRENSTRANIRKDTLFPLAKLWRSELARGDTIAVITARVMSVHDYVFLDIHNLYYHFMLHRTADCDLPTEEMKRLAFHQLRNRSGVDFRLMRYFEDDDKCLQMSRNLGIQAYDAKLYRQRNLDAGVV